MTLAPESTAFFQEATARSGTYRLLARLWLREVDRDIVAVLQSSSVREFFVHSGGVLPLDDDEGTLEELAIDYCQLFIGPSNHLPPLQSVWQSGQLHGETVDSMKTFANIAGYDIDRLPRGTMVDHLGVELDLMGHLLGQVATLQPEKDHFDQALDLTRSYFALHLKWSSKLLEIAQHQAKTDFYRATIQLTRDFLSSEAAAW